MPIPKRILVPVDFSPCSRAALEYSYLLAEQFAATLDVVHSWAAPQYIGPDMAIFGEPGATLWEYARAAASKEMEQFLAPFQERARVKIDSRLEQGEPHGTILNIANAGKFDMIVMGTHGRTGLSRVFLGSIAERVVRHSRCPVRKCSGGLA